MTKLFIKSVRSYHPDIDAEFDFSSKVTLIYGLNGSGKSTVSGYFFNPKNPEYGSCRLTLEEDIQFLVFNQDYIDENFHNSQTQPGVFTLNNENAEIAKKIERNKEIITKNNNKITLKKSEILEKTSLKESVLTKIIDEIWNRTSNIRKSQISNLLNGISRKQKLFEVIDAHNIVNSNELIELEERYTYLEKFKDIQYICIPKLTLPVLTDEEHRVLSSPLLSSSNSHLSKLIEKLSNADWVRAGIKYLSENQCPFCQQNIDDEKFKQQLTEMFDENYNETLLKIEGLKQRYTVWKAIIDNYLVYFDAPKELIDDNLLSKNISEIRHHYSSNEILIVKKLFSPSESINLKIDSEATENLLNQINDINKKILGHNQKIDNYDNEREILKQDFLSHLKFINEASIKRYHEHQEEVDSTINRLNDEIKNINIQNQELQEENRIKASEIVNIEDTIDKINNSLVSLGITGFTLIKHQDQAETYKLHREGQSNTKSVFKSLSEGEKTIISFLYFIEQCKGLKNKNDIIREKFIVIDDPISSLSHNYIYEISSMIFNDLILKEVAKKFIILTHSLFFFQELVITASSEKNIIKNWSFYRIIKGNHSQCLKLKRDELLNEYQSLWQTLKDAKIGITNPVILPNVMRNILEYYFSFSCKKDRLKEVLKALAESHAEPRYNSFYRFINRHSHSDGKNIQTIGAIDAEVYLEMFEKIFTDTGDQAHFIAMMGNETIA